MRIRPGRTRSLVGGILALLVMFVGLWMMSRFGGFGGPPWPFMLLWVLIGLGGAAASFYNAFSRRGLPLYEIDTDSGEERFCPRCGAPVGLDDQFCSHCGASLQ
jgi:ribosomal protein S27AE